MATNSSTNLASGSNQNSMQRAEISYFEGVNAFVDSHVAKRYEFKHAENARSNHIGSVEKRNGTVFVGDNLDADDNLGLFYFENNNANSNGLFKVIKDGTEAIMYWFNTTTDSWTQLVDNLAYEDENGDPLPYDFTIAEGQLFVTNRIDRMFYIDKDLTVYTTASVPTYANHVYVSPYAAKLNFYKDRLYVADYFYDGTGSVRVPNGIGFSSYPLGLVALVAEERLTTDPHPNDIYVTDTTYIRGDGTDELEVYRGGSLIGDFEVTGKTEDMITTTTPPPAYDILASDELWIKGTYGDQQKIFRWPDTFGGKSPTEQKTYDTFKLSGEQNGPITMLANVGDVMVYANRENMGVWNDHYAKSLDLGIGCSSYYGYVKLMGTLWFIDYNGIYATTGAVPVLKSAKVEPYIKGATRQGLENACAGKKGYSVFFSIGEVTLYNDDGSVMRKLEHVVLEYNMRQENWYVHTEINARQFVSYKDEDTPDLLAYNDGGHAGRHTYEFLNKDRWLDATPTGDKEIQFRVDTTDLTLSEQFELISYPKEFIIEATRGSTISIFMSLDGAPFYQVTGDASKGCTIVKTERRDGNIETEPRCRQLRISIRDYTRKPCKLSRMAIIFIETLEEEPIRESSVESING